MSLFLKSAGACLMVASGFLGGMFYASRIRQHVVELEKALLFLTGLRQELRFSLSPPEDLIGYLSSYHEFESTDYIQNAAKRTAGGELFQSAWRGAVEESVLALDAGDRQILRSVGEILGSSDLDSQLNCLEHCTEQIRGKLLIVQPKAEERSKLARTIGMLAGVFSAILIV